MDRENTNRERAYSSYLSVVCRPLLVTYLILVDDQEVNNMLLRDGIDKNKKSLETRIDDSMAKWRASLILIYIATVSTLIISRPLIDSFFTFKEFK